MNGTLVKRRAQRGFSLGGVIKFDCCRGAVEVAPQQFAQGTPRSHISIPVLPKNKAIRAGLLVGRECFVESTKPKLVAIKIGAPDVNLLVFKLELLRVWGPAVVIIHWVILFDSFECCEHLGPLNLRQPNRPLPSLGSCNVGL